MAGIVVAWFGSWWWMYWRPEIPGCLALYIYIGTGYWIRIVVPVEGFLAAVLGLCPACSGLSARHSGVGGTPAARQGSTNVGTDSSAESPVDGLTLAKRKRLSAVQLGRCSVLKGLLCSCVFASAQEEC